MILFYQSVLACATIGFIWSEVLTQPGNIFNKVYNQIDKLPKWLSKPLGGCALCTSGQLAFWTYLFIYYDQYQFTDVGKLITTLFFHVYFICATILVTWILLKIQKEL